jgi:hypothetical protein
LALRPVIVEVTVLALVIRRRLPAVREKVPPERASVEPVPMFQVWGPERRARLEVIAVVQRIGRKRRCRRRRG